jgi:L-alanine-DL-glutamate epimerase-like enolase superfamily enzyme
MSLWDLVKDLPLTCDAYTLEGLSQEVSSGFERQSTVIHLNGGGHVGLGEDVVYDAVDHEAFQGAGPVHDLTGPQTLGDFTELIESLDLFPTKGPEREVSRLYRRWSFDSAALDLALRQADTNLSALVGREAQPLSFVVSTRLGDAPELTPVTSRLKIQPGLQFKLDPTGEWTEEIVAALAETGAVESVDFKSFYKEGPVVQTGKLPLYEMVIGGLPNAWIEDPDLTIPEVDEFLIPHRDRISWDANIHSIDDIEALPFKPKMVNVKPSRIGGLRRLLDTYDYCEREGIGMYSGGQFELGVGRDHVQLLSSVFHPDSPNDVAPTGWNTPQPASPLPGSPLVLGEAETGFRLA